jgi:hypothetical protein
MEEVMRFNILETLFPTATINARFSHSDHLALAKAFVGKGGLYQAFCIGLPVKGGLYQKLQVLFVLQGDQAYWKYLALYQSYLAEKVPTPELLLEVRKQTFATIWGGYNPTRLQAPAQKDPFLPDELNLLVLPMGWHSRVAELERDLKLPSGKIEEIREQVVLLASDT